MAAAATFEGLVEIMDRLRDPGGCPWDREQTYATLRGFLIEECYEVVDALDRSDLPSLCEELGDLLFQVVFLSKLAREDGAFSVGQHMPNINKGYNVSDLARRKRERASGFPFSGFPPAMAAKLAALRPTQTKP